MTFYIHIGYPKTSSTFLQQEILPKIKNCNILNKDKPEIRNNILYKLVVLDEAEYNNNKKNIIYELHQEVKKINKTDNIILSWPGFTHPIKFHTKTNKNVQNIFRTILRLNDIFGNIGKVKIILVIRNFIDLIESFFFQINHLLKFDFRDEHLIQTLKKEDEKYKNLIDSFSFPKLINFMLNNNINNSVIIYEDLINDILKFKTNLADAFNNEEIKSIDFENLAKIRINSTNKKKKITYKLKGIFLNLWEFTKKPSSFLYIIRNIKKFLKKQNININKKNYGHLVHNYFMQDYEELPENIKQQCNKYNYINYK